MQNPLREELLEQCWSTWRRVAASSSQFAQRIKVERSKAKENSNESKQNECLGKHCRKYRLPMPQMLERRGAESARDGRKRAAAMLGMRERDHTIHAKQRRQDKNREYDLGDERAGCHNPTIHLRDFFGSPIVEQGEYIPRHKTEYEAGNNPLEPHLARAHGACAKVLQPHVRKPWAREHPDKKCTNDINNTQGARKRCTCCYWIKMHMIYTLTTNTHSVAHTYRRSRM